MLDKFTSENSRDWRQRYASSWGWLVTGNEEKIVFINDVRDGVVTFTTEHNGHKYEVYEDSPVQFRFSQVPTGWFVDNAGNPFFACRRPARQWCRGISESNTRFLYTHKSVAFLPGGLNWDNVVACLSGQKKSPKQEETSDVLSNNFAVVNGKVFARSMQIGTFSKGLISLNNDLFAQEVSDVIRRGQLAYKLEVK